MGDSIGTLLILGDLQALLLAAGALTFAYTIFALVGFGSALIAGAPLAGIMPVASVVPLLALLDCFGSLARGWKSRHLVALHELRRLVPAMLLGQLSGVLLLSRLPGAVTAVLLGCFIVGYGIRGLARRESSFVPAGSGAMVHGLTGGVLGGLFGSGGFMYAAYLERRLEDRQAFRATQAVLIALSTAWRVGLCVAAGLIDRRLVVTAIALLPVVVLGGLLGRRIDLRLSRGQIFLVLNALLVVSGMALVVRVVGGY